LTEWLNKLKIGLNVGKTVAVLFGDRSAHDIHEICVLGKSVHWRPDIKYLGAYFHKILQFHHHAKLFCERARRLDPPFTRSKTTTLMKIPLEDKT